MSKPDSFIAGQSLLSKIVYRFGWLVVVPFIRFYTRTTINGRSNIPTEGAFVLAPVHRSYVDTFIAGYVTSRRMRFMGKDTMWNNRFAGWFLSSFGAFPVSRGTADRQAMRRSIAVLEAGEPLVLFPEGERKEGETVFPVFAGAVYIAIKAGVPIIPVGIGGSELVMPKKSKLLYPRKVHIEIGPPIPPPDVAPGERVNRDVYRQYSDALHDELQRLFDISMTRVPWDYPVED